MKEKIITEQEISQFEKHLKTSEKSTSTIQKYIRDVRKLQSFAGGKKLTRDLMLKYKETLEKNREYKISSINSYLTAANRFCSFMKWEQLCVKTIKVQKSAFESEEKELTKEEYHRLVQAAMKNGDEFTALILQTIASTGIRIGELPYIRAEYLEKGVIDIHHKGKARRILLPTALTGLLQAYTRKHHITNGVIFCNRKGAPIDRKYIWRHMKKAALLAGVPAEKVFPHNLRHLFAKEFYRQTGDIMKLADILGHSNINTTRIYIRTAGREHKEQLDAMDMVVLAEDSGICRQQDPTGSGETPSTPQKAENTLAVMAEYVPGLIRDQLYLCKKGNLCEVKIRIL